MSKKDINETLEQEIGSFGSEEQVESTGIGLGKLKNKAAYGQKEDLDNAEQDSLNRFLNKGRQLKETQMHEEEVELSQGWIPVDREQMGIRSQFYPDAWEFFIKPATMNAIKNWTAIDESKPDQVNRVFDEIIKQCVKIETHSLSTAGWANINSWDRFWFILKVREYTFSNNDTKIEFEDDCTECGQPIKYNLTADSLHYEFPDDDLINDYWNGHEWEIIPSDYDVDHEPITLYTPKLGKDAAIIEWATAKAHANQKIDETFIEFLVWLLDKPNKDMQMLDRQIKKIYNDYKKWDVEMFSFMRDVIKNVTINPSENLSARCPHCGQETVSGVQFPDGIKALFACQTSTRKKFGSR
jgi:hypothetical protein